MSTIEVRDDIAAALATAAAKRGLTADELAANVLAQEFGPTEPRDALTDFIRSIDSVDPDWAPTDTWVNSYRCAHCRLLW